MGSVILINYIFVQVDLPGRLLPDQHGAACSHYCPFTSFASLMILQESHLHELGHALGAECLSCAATAKEEKAAPIQMLQLANPLTLSGCEVVPAVQVVKISSRPCTRLSYQHHVTAACKEGVLETFEIMLAVMGPLERVEIVFYFAHDKQEFYLKKKILIKLE